MIGISDGRWGVASIQDEQLSRPSVEFGFLFEEEMERIQRMASSDHDGREEIWLSGVSPQTGDQSTCRERGPVLSSFEVRKD